MNVGTAKVIVKPDNPDTSMYYNSKTVTFQIVNSKDPHPVPPAPAPEPEPSPGPGPTPTPPAVTIQSVSISGLKDSYNEGEAMQANAIPVFSDGSTHSDVNYT